MTAVVAIVSFLQAIGFGVVSSLSARRKNRDVLAWFFAGFVFSFFGFVASLLVEDEPVDERTISAWATVSFLLGMLGILIPIAAIPAVICGHVAVSKTRKAPGKYGGKVRYMGGLILGYIELAVALIGGVYLTLTI